MESGNGGRGRIRREWLKVEEAGNTEKATGEPTAEEEAEQVTYEVDRGGGDHEHAGEASQAEDRPRARRACTQSRQLCSKTPMSTRKKATEAEEAEKTSETGGEAGSVESTKEVAGGGRCGEGVEEVAVAERAGGAGLAGSESARLWTSGRWEVRGR